ncbi:hypothetical protein [Robertmurraya massiliosenegalensis]|uniref:hypothetical protein n=1 Tax=Robertmurraya massiliosenegalensis TaxID=1287657 RepID=UPI000303193C|nr:hypothetical protein [Robertmurraya massiliosenegalensis]
MSVGQYYNMCCKGIGRPVQIRTYDGRTHRGVIERATPNRVFLRPFGGGRNFGGYGYGYYGGGFGGGGWGFGWGIALGTIAALAFIPFFF